MEQRLSTSGQYNKILHKKWIKYTLFFTFKRKYRLHCCRFRYGFAVFRLVGGEQSSKQKYRFLLHNAAPCSDIHFIVLIVLLHPGNKRCLLQVAHGKQTHPCSHVSTDSQCTKTCCEAADKPTFKKP